MKIFVGYEEEYPESFTVCKSSIERFNTTHEIVPLIKTNLIREKLYSRPVAGENTDFAFTRFLVPYLCDYKGYALFCDGDFMWRCDPAEIEAFQDDEYAIHVVKHPQLITSEHMKMNSHINIPYEKKYWSSLMYMDCTESEVLTIDYVNTATASDLHSFKWLPDDIVIGELPVTYNMLLGYYQIDDPKAVHFTDGGPWLEGYESVEYADEWNKIKNSGMKNFGGGPF
jgi:hypothetical protein